MDSPADGITTELADVTALRLSDVRSIEPAQVTAFVSRILACERDSADPLLSGGYHEDRQERAAR
ncbi:hypothetical protein LO762_00140 [Actinocorallia sp. API 0066]|uniref:hypothetical protein n=1 Tax=Actinocorallia sp. API 0066 TaxID=2896846 RepID=UPI001E2BE880|nr:hypothetical protein [Actinocorallia sp. API 0066]MCD0447611.1 hypothetical protein [Actinocorallia sp. API 0066]